MGRMFVLSSSTSRGIALLLTCLSFAPVVLGARVARNGNRNQVDREDLKHADDPESASAQYEALAEIDDGEAGLLQQANFSSEHDSGTSYALSKVSSGFNAQFSPKCPKLYQKPNEGIPNIIHVRIVGISNLPWKLSDTPDSYVRFWIGKKGKINGPINKLFDNYEKKWLAKTPYLNNQRDPHFNFGCTFFYTPKEATDGNNVLHVEVMEREYLPDWQIAVIGTKKDGQDFEEGVRISEILKHDSRADGDFDVTFSLYSSSGKKKKGRDTTSTINMHINILHDPSLYMLTKAKNRVSHAVGHIE